MNTHEGRHARSGFTLVELLIVIVVIAILAAIITISYQGMRQRADNVRRIAAAKQVQTLFKLYAAMYEKNPADAAAASGGVCMTIDNSCSNYVGAPVVTSNATLMTELRKVGTPPQGINASAGIYYGLYLDWNSTRTYNGQLSPYLMMFWLNGEQQKCALPDTVMATAMPDTNVTTTKGYTYSGAADDPADAGLTECWVSL